MPHDWILQVLADLRAYALANDLPATAAMAAEALMVARAELEFPGDDPSSGSGSGTPPPQSAPH